MGGKIRTEPVKVREPDKPKCPIHGTVMVYDPEHVRWGCTNPNCKQIAFPPEELEKGKPILGRGELELVRMKDPDGSKDGRYILRSIDNNVMIDVTDDVNSQQGKFLTLYINNIADNR